MPDRTPNIGAHVSIAKESLQDILKILREMDYTLVGPTLGEAAIVYEEIDDVDDLPIGWTAEQEAGTYRLTERGDGAYFGYASGPHSWKKFLFPPELKMTTVERKNGGFTMMPIKRDVPQYAFIGVRPCDMHAIEVQDRVFLGEPYQEPSYKARRQRSFILAVNCTEPGGTCFCASMGTGPKIDSGFDLSLTELDDIFVVRVGSELGAHVMTTVEWRPAPSSSRRRAKLSPTPRRTWVANWIRRTSPTCCTRTWSIRAGSTWLNGVSRAPTAPRSARRASAATCWKPATLQVRRRPAPGCGTPAST